MIFVFPSILVWIILVYVNQTIKIIVPWKSWWNKSLRIKMMVLSGKDHWIKGRLEYVSGQISIIPKPECFGDFGGIP